MDILLSPFLENLFMQRALLAGILVSVTCAVVGTFVVLRGLAFIGDAFAHGVLPGIAIAMLLGLPGMLGAAVGTVFIIGGISLITRKSKLSADTAIGLLFIGMLALGVLIVSRSQSFTGDIVRILFGEILGISQTDIIIQAVAMVVIIVITAFCVRPFLLLCFNQEQAQIAGFSPRLFHNIMLGLIALAVIVSFQTVGTLLVFGMLIAPAAAGALLARRIEGMIGWAAVLGSLAVYIGLLLSYHFNLAAGSAIVVVVITLFFIVLAIRSLQLRQKTSSSEHHHG